MKILLLVLYNYLKKNNNLKLIGGTKEFIFTNEKINCVRQMSLIDFYNDIYHVLYDYFYGYYIYNTNPLQKYIEKIFDTTKKEGHIPKSVLNVKDVKLVTFINEC